jgi:hypothetical protein
MDISKLPIKAIKRVRTTDPKDIFKSLTLRGSVQNIWGPQAEALEAWHQHRHLPDVVVGMNTGGGKTLVGLLIAQSLVNETQGKVLYVCPTNQLVEQVASKASECGISVATYMGGAWNNERTYTTAVGPCVTNYAAVFNSKTTFREHDMKAVIFDDAHVASNFVRSQFTLKIPSGHAAFKELAQLFRAHFYYNSQTQQFDDMLNGDRLALLFAPMFEVRRQADAMRQILIKHGVDSPPDTGFPWRYLKDHLTRCVTILSGSGIEIAPPLLPVHTLPYFRSSTRRIYLTATLPTQVEFLRTFGIVNPQPIVPGGKSGDAQRLFLFPQGDTDEGQRATVLDLTSKLKACIITSSDQDAATWCPPATKFSGARGHHAIQEFAKSGGADKLVLAARYDGVDLPGDACRVLILDGLPRGASLFERFLDQGLRLERLRASHMAVRITQAIGRIFRSNTDHGAVFICGSDLEKWLSDPDNQKHLPRLLQQQINFGIELRRMVDEKRTTSAELLDGVLKGKQEWDKLYSDNVEAFETQEQPIEPAWFAKLVVDEVSAFQKLWDGNFAAAALQYRSIADEAEPHDSRLAAWFRHWEGLAHDLGRDDDAAMRAYVRAANSRVELGRPKTKMGVVAAAEEIRPSGQAKAILTLLKKKGQKTLSQLGDIEKALSDGSQTNPVEQALEDLGASLGLESSRPDRGSGSGPDVLWRHTEDRTGVALEAKTNKKPTSQYTKKDDIGQFHDHLGWLAKNHPAETFLKVVVGPKLQVSRDSNPPTDLRVVPLEQFVALAKRTKECLEIALAMPGDPEKLASIERGLRDLGLSWPSCIESLESFLALDLQGSYSAGEEIS